MAMSKILLSLSLTPPPPSTTPISNPPCTILLSRRISILTALITTTTTSIVNIPCAAAQTPPPPSSSNSSKSFLSGISNTKSWFQFYGSGFSIRVPPNFEDIMEPEDYNAGLSLYGDKAKPKTFAARFASTDGSEVVSVVVRPSNSLKITFLEAKDITDLGSLKEAAKIFVPGGTTLYSARTIKIKEDEGYRYLM
ncbi:hypothetical protein ACJIZ3_018648 [Penstemon smallii]|uniref:Uncharacterized protein n=1 Tax=Penstemon smallii TaxID=265156 RepID=A0ABD3SZK6_9LAMI